MSRWFRHYAGMMRDEKLVSVAVRSKQPIERVVWIWGAILESAAEINDNGKFTLDTAEIAYFLRAEQTELDCIVGVLEGLGRISGDRVVKWGDRQFSSDKSADRTRTYRERQKGAADNNQNVTEQGHDDAVTPGDGDVTACDGHSDAPETETEANTEKKEAIGSKRTRYPWDFEKQFWEAYPRTPTMSKKEAASQWKRLSIDDRLLAIASVPRYAAFLKSKPDHPVVHACRFLSQRRFDGFADGAMDQKPGAIGFPVKPESDQWRAWLLAASPFQKSLMQRAQDTGQPFVAPTEWPANSATVAA